MMMRGWLSKSFSLRLWAAAFCVAPLVIAAERGAESRVESREGKGERPGEAGPFEHQSKEHRTAVDLEEEWKHAEAFLSTHSPNRLHQFNRLANGQSREILKRFLVNRYRTLSAVKEESPELYDVRVKEVEVDDKIFSICHELKKHPNREHPGLRKQLRESTAELYDLSLKERRLRIGLVEKTLADQKTSLATDETNREIRIAERYDALLEHGVEGARFDKKVAKTQASE